MFFLLDDAIKMNLNNFEALPETMETIPDGLTQEQTRHFIRILQAQKPSEIEDITTEKIIELLYLVQGISPHIGKSNIFDNSNNRFKNILLEAPSVKHRRVL